jgi:hypothetical protein
MHLQNYRSPMSPIDFFDQAKIICDAGVSGLYRSDETERTPVIEVCDFRRISGKLGRIND